MMATRISNLMTSCRHFGERNWLMHGWLLGLLAFSLLLKLALILQTGPHDKSIFEMEYGFGGVINSLYHRNSLEACGIAYALDFCGIAFRMPLLPMLYAKLAMLIGTSQIALAITKTIVFQALITASLLYLFNVLSAFPLRRLALVLIAGLTLLGPQYLKHSISIQYEESLLLDLFIVYFTLLAGVVFKQRLGQALSTTDRGIVIGLALIGGSLYFIKSSLILFGLVAIAAPVWLVKTPAWLRIAVFLPFIIGLTGWGWLNESYHGELRLTSSYNGENFYRGQNPYTYRMYPDINLDRIIDSREVQLNNGEILKLPDWTVNFPKFAGEWQWHDYFQNLGKQWIHDNPGQALELTLRKLYVIFLEPGKVPFRQSGQLGAEPLDYSLVTLLAGSAWIVVMRVLFFIALGMAIGHLWRRDEDWRPALVFLLFIGAYVAPYVAGFAYQRHITPLLVFAVCAWPLLSFPGGSISAKTPE
jgi:hypothetical protein